MRFRVQVPRLASEWSEATIQEGPQRKVFPGLSLGCASQGTQAHVQEGPEEGRSSVDQQAAGSRMWEGLGLQVFLMCLGAMLCSAVAASAPLEHSHRHRLSLHRHRERTGKEGQVLHRSKRGWVWNQFFVIEEYTGPDPVLVGRVRSLF